MRSASAMSSTRSTLQLRSPRIDPALTKNAWIEASSSSLRRPKTSMSVSESKTTAFCSPTVRSMAI